MPPGLRTAVGFLTRIPMGETEGVLARAVGWFPVVGALVGAVQGGVLVAAGRFVDPMLAAAVSVAVSTLVTGAFHLDGIADVADAFGGGWNRDERLAILKDSRLGTYGTATVALVLLIEVGALSSIVESRWPVTIAAVICAHSVSRTAAVMTMRLASPARGDGLGAAYVAEVGPAALAQAMLVGGLTLVGYAALSSDGLVALAIVVVAVILATGVVTIAVVMLSRSKIGGITGDVLGAVQQVSALAVLIVLAAR